MRSNRALGTWSTVSLLLALSSCSGSPQPASSTPSNATQAADPIGQAAPHEAFEPTKRFVDLSTGIRIAYVELGPSDGEPVIMLAGITDTARSFYPTMEALGRIAPNLRVIALDSRGHGDSSMPAGAECPADPQRCFETADFAADVLAFMDQQQLERAHIVGHSMSSLVAQELALAHPERVASLVLIGAFVNGTDAAIIEDFLLDQAIEGRWKSSLEQRPGFVWPRDGYSLTPLDAEPNAEQWMLENWVFELLADPVFLATVAAETARIRLGTWLGASKGMQSVDNRLRLEQLRAPVLVLWATQDTAFPEDPHQQEVRAALDRAVAACSTTYVFKTYGKQPLPPSGMQESDLGHNTHWGAPELVAADIAAFIATGRPTADLPFADPSDPSKLLVEPGAAKLIIKESAACP